MLYYRQFAVQLYVLGLLFSCQKDVATTPNSSEAEYNLEIELQDGQVMGYTEYNSKGEVVAITKNTFDAFHVTQTGFYTWFDSVKYFRYVYEMDNGVATTMYDTSFIDGQDTNVRIIHFRHNQLGRIIEEEYNFISKTDTGTSMDTLWERYIYKGSNVYRTEKEHSGYNAVCYDYYYSTNFTPNVNVNNLDESIIGKRSENLILGITTDIGCPGGPSYKYPYYHYKYKLDESGYVTEIIFYDQNDTTTTSVTYIFK